MLTKTKIDLKKYLFFSILTTMLFLIAASGRSEVLAIVFIYFATVVNQWMLLELVFIVLQHGEIDGQKLPKSKVLGLAFGKIIILFVAFYFGVQFMGNKIILPLINYVIQIFILILTIKKK